MRFVSLLILAVSLTACDRALEVPETPQATAAAPSCGGASDEASCRAAGCAPVLCSSCGESATFYACDVPGASTGEGSPCPQTGCASVSNCTTITDLGTCEATAGCYALFGSPLKCDALPCAQPFRSCRIGAPMCEQTQPDLCGDDSPGFFCGSGFSLAYESDDCEAGCVRERLCPPSPPPV